MREKLNEWMLIVFLIVAVMSFPLGATVFHFLVRASLEKQEMLDAEGVPIAARLVSKDFERKFRQGRRVGISDRGTRVEESCHIDIEYTVGNSKDVHHTSAPLDDADLCGRYSVGDTISGRAMPEDPQVMLLDDNRVGTHWYWISLFMMVAFIAGPIFFIIKAMQKKTARGS